MFWQAQSYFWKKKTFEIVQNIFGHVEGKGISNGQISNQIDLLFVLFLVSSVSSHPTPLTTTPFLAATTKLPSKTAMSRDGPDILEYPFLTLRSFPEGFIQRLGMIVHAVFTYYICFYASQLLNSSLNDICK